MIPLVLLLNLAATLYMTGLIWFVQVVHYPLFNGVGDEKFAAYEGRHTRLTTWVVLPPMVTELITAVLLVFYPVPGVSRGVLAAGLLMVLAAWGVTFLLSVPQHAVLERGFDPRAHRRLVTTNWLRTWLWSVRAALMLWVVGRLLALPS